MIRFGRGNGQIDHHKIILEENKNRFLERSGKNTSIETIILPACTYPNILGAALDVMFALESIFVPVDKVETYKTSWDASLVG